MMKAPRPLVPLLRIKEIRSGMGLSQTDLARKTGICNSVLSDAEKGCTSTRLPALVRIADALGVPVDDLLVR
ncbi:MAG: helix-turn-helix transcriptional regulator [Candidatus Cybelea sp.]